MTLNEFGAIVKQRIPTPEEFVAVVNGQKWRIAIQEGGKASLIVPDSKDRLAIAFARMLSREPYRTNVLRVVLEMLTASTVDVPKPNVADEPPRTQQQCRGFTTVIGKNKTPTQVPCGAWFWVKEDCAEVCINRHCPQKEMG